MLSHAQSQSFSPAVNECDRRQTVWVCATSALLEEEPCSFRMADFPYQCSGIRIRDPNTHPPPNSYNYFDFKKKKKSNCFLLLTAHLWVKNCRELMQSSYNKERLDQPLQASAWLKNFKTSNERFLKEVCRACQVVLS